MALEKIFTHIQNEIEVEKVFNLFNGAPRDDSQEIDQTRIFSVMQFEILT